MAITLRHGNFADFDPNKLVQDELAIVDDRGEMYFCYSPGSVKQLATSNDLQEMLDSSGMAYEALQQLISDLETNPSELTNILANISALQTDKLDKTGDSEYNTVTFTEATTDSDIAAGDTHATLFGKILKRFHTLATSIGLKANQTSLDTTNTVVATKANKSVISDAYSASATYAVGDYCIYNDTLYRCSTAIATAEDWNAAHWTATKVQAEVKTLNDNLVKKALPALTMVTLQNGWTGTLMYTKDDLGYVRLRGTIITGTKTVGTIIANLPIGYRPSSMACLVPVWMNAHTMNPCHLLIGDSGNIFVQQDLATSGGTTVNINVVFSTY